MFLIEDWTSYEGQAEERTRLTIGDTMLAERRDESWSRRRKRSIFLLMKV